MLRSCLAEVWWKMAGVGPTPPFTAEEFIEQQASTDNKIGLETSSSAGSYGQADSYGSLAEAKVAWGVDAPALSLAPDPTNPPPQAQLAAKAGGPRL